MCLFALKKFMSVNLYFGFDFEASSKIIKNENHESQENFLLVRKIFPIAHPLCLPPTPNQCSIKLSHFYCEG